jgi:hypothetical protein
MPGSYVFTPESNKGASNPPFKGQPCFGQSLDGYAENIFNNERDFTLSFLIGYQNYFSGRSDFFNAYFDKLAGNSELRRQILAGKTEDEIRATWVDDLEDYMLIREKYLLYKDFSDW